jgi:flagellar protein FlaG
MSGELLGSIGSATAKPLVTEPSDRPTPRRPDEDERTQEAKDSALRAPATVPPERSVVPARAAEAPDEEVYREVAEAMKAHLEEIHEKGYLRELRMEVDVSREDGSMQVKVLDARTDKVIRTVPPEEQIQFAQRMTELFGLLFDEVA